MAHGKNYWKKRQTRQGGRFLRRAGGVVSNPSVSTVARAAWSGVKYLRTLVNAERHFGDLTGNTQPVAGTPQSVNLIQIAQGDTIQTRTGNSILLKSLQLKGYFVKHASATNSVVRYFIIRDKQQVSDTVPSFTDIFDGTGINCQLNINNLGRYQILHSSKPIFLTTNNPDHKFNIYKKFMHGKHHVRFNGTATTDIQRNGLYFYYITQEATNTPSIDWASRISFYDN